MSKPSNGRLMSVSEREFLEQLLKSSPTTAKRCKEGVENALVLWAVLMLLFVIAWLFIAWLARTVMNWEIGTNSSAAIRIVAGGGLASAIAAAVSSIRWVKKWQDIRPLLQADLQNNQVLEEHYRFSAAKLFQEPEHDGLIYFLRTTDGKVLVLYDDESQDLGAGGDDPFGSTFKPASDLSIVQAPNSGVVISKQFSGTPLNAGELFELSVDSELWPEPDTYCDIPWDALEERFSLRSLP